MEKSHAIHISQQLQTRHININHSKPARHYFISRTEYLDAVYSFYDKKLTFCIFQLLLVYHDTNQAKSAKRHILNNNTTELLQYRGKNYLKY